MVTENASGQDKLVSIICRTVGRPVLTHTLESVLSQTYPHIELILVNAANSDLSKFKNLIESLNTVIVCLERPLGRSEAANVGLEASTGDYLMFLDDDDWIDTDHITTLVNYLNNHSDSKAAYSSVQKTDAEGEDIPYVFESDYDPITLMRDNYIPIHAMVFARSLVEKGCRFDEAFNIYEDWDFWLQMSRETIFHHIPRSFRFDTQKLEQFMPRRSRGSRRLEHRPGRRRGRSTPRLRCWTCPRVRPTVPFWSTRMPAQSGSPTAQRARASVRGPARTRAGFPRLANFFSPPPN